MAVHHTRPTPLCLECVHRNTSGSRAVLLLGSESSCSLSSFRLGMSRGASREQTRHCVWHWLCERSAVIMAHRDVTASPTLLRHLLHPADSASSRLRL